MNGLSEDLYELVPQDDGKSMRQRYTCDLHEVLPREASRWFREHPDPIRVIHRAIEIRLSPDVYMRSMLSDEEARAVIEKAFQEASRQGRPLRLVSILRDRNPPGIAHAMNAIITPEMMAYELSRVPAEDVAWILILTYPHFDNTIEHAVKVRHNSKRSSMIRQAVRETLAERVKTELLKNHDCAFVEQLFEVLHDVWDRSWNWIGGRLYVADVVNEFVSFGIGYFAIDGSPSITTGAYEEDAAAEAYVSFLQESWRALGAFLCESFRDVIEDATTDEALREKLQGWIDKYDKWLESEEEE